MTSGEKIKALRIYRNLTQKKLGELCNIAESTIRRYELGLLNPKFETLDRISDALDVDVNDLLPSDERRHLFYPNSQKLSYSQVLTDVIELNKIDRDDFNDDFNSMFNINSGSSNDIFTEQFDIRRIEDNSIVLSPENESDCSIAYYINFTIRGYILPCNDFVECCVYLEYSFKGLSNSLAEKEISEKHTELFIGDIGRSTLSKNLFLKMYDELNDSGKNEIYAQLRKIHSNPKYLN